MESPGPLEQLRRRMAIAVGENAVFDGWTKAAVDAAAGQIGVDTVQARLAIPKTQAGMIDVYIQEVDRAFIGKHPQPSMPFRTGAKPFPIRTPPPTLGEHNQEILGGLLGLSDAEIDQLAREGIIGTEMLMEEQLVKEKKRAAG